MEEQQAEYSNLQPDYLDRGGGSDKICQYTIALNVCNRSTRCSILQNFLTGFRLLSVVDGGSTDDGIPVMNIVATVRISGRDPDVSTYSHIMKSGDGSFKF